MLNIPFDNTYKILGDTFYVKTQPVSVAQPKLIKLNTQLIKELGLSDANLESGEALDMFAGNKLPDGAEPIAMAYAGHQFGHFNQQLGDGRAVQLGEIIDPDKTRFDIQLKGSGPTAFSRGGDGRAALGPVLREYLLCEAMAKLGVPTTRALAAVTTGEEVARDQLMPGAVLTRLATSYVRVGTFQYFAVRNQREEVQQLADYVIQRNYPDITDATNADNRYVVFLQAVIERQAVLIAQWMQLGFIHGVMNTDNMSIAGETIDYGPCAFMDTFNHHQVYSSIDRNGRYAYSNQPMMAQWNLVRLTETLLPLLADDKNAAVEIAEALLTSFKTRYEDHWLTGMRKKLGLSSEQETDKALIDDLLKIMEEQQADFTLTFYHLSRLDSQDDTNDHTIRSLFIQPEAFNDWATRWRKRLSDESLSDKDTKRNMRSVNPLYIPRNHRIEAAIRAAEDHQDFSVFHELHDVLQDPYKFQSGRDIYMQPPQADEIVQQTFCGT